MQADASVKAQVKEVLERFNDLVSTQNMQVLSEFAPGDDVILIGSEVGEVVTGREAIEAFFVRIFARDTTCSWEWERIDVSHAGDLAWFFAEGRVILSTAKGQRKAPYRISGVLEHHEGKWLWRHYHGSEPVTYE